MTRLNAVIEEAINSIIIEGEEYPEGATERAKTAIDELRKAIADKHIWNVDFEECKQSLTRQFDQFGDPMRMKGISQDAYNLMYTLSPSLINLRNIVKWTSHVEKLLNNKEEAGKWVNRIVPSSIALPADFVRKDQIPHLEEIWHARDEVLGVLQKTKTWAMVQPLIDQAKGYVQKGRKPSVKPSNIYTPPVASINIKNLVIAKLKEIVDPLTPQAIENLYNYFVGIVEPLTGKEFAYNDFYGRTANKQVRNLREMFGQNLFISKGTTILNMVFQVRPDYKEWLKLVAEKQVKDMVERYIYKNTAKLASIIQTKGEYKSAEPHGTLRGWGFAGSIVFEFKDGTGFTVHNQAVQKYSYSGTPFVQFPTTFHDVTFPDGSFKKMVPEKEMNEIWALQKAG